jgi:Rrf2 family protein
VIFTTKAEYGVRLMVELGRQGAETPTSLKAIAEAEGLPLAYLERIVALLKKAGLVESTRGAHGGYRLARDPATCAWTRSSSRSRAPWRP